MRDGVSLISEERSRQIEHEQYSNAHDDTHEIEEIALAAPCYAIPNSIRGQIADKINCTNIDTFLTRLWPWGWEWWKPAKTNSGGVINSIEDRVRELTKAGALIAAEIDRLQRIPVGKLLNR